MIARRTFLRVSVYAAGVAALGCSPLLAGCSLSPSSQLRERYGAPLTAVFAPWQSSQLPMGQLAQLIATGGDVGIASEGQLADFQVSDGDVLARDGSAMGASAAQAGDSFEVYVKGEGGEAVLLLTSNGGQGAADEANAWMAREHAGCHRAAYVPLSDGEHASVASGETSSMRVVVIDGEDSSLAFADVPDLAMFRQDGGKMELGELEPGDVFDMYSSLATLSSPPRYGAFRLELVERGGQDVVERYLDVAQGDAE